MCREFGCLPSELENEPADKVYLYFNILNLYDHELEEKRKRNSKSKR